MFKITRETPSRNNNNNAIRSCFILKVISTFYMLLNRFKPDINQVLNHLKSIRWYKMKVGAVVAIEAYVPMTWYT